MRRNALVVGVGAFSTKRDADDPAAPGVFGYLDFTEKRAKAISSSLDRFGYEIARKRNSSAVRLRSAMEGLLGAGGPSIVYFIGHGGIEDGRLYLAGSDSYPQQLRATAFDLFSHLDKVNGSADGPLTLFIVDSCHAGKAVQYVLSKGEQRAWVLAAAHGDSPAFTGRFSEALSQVLDGIADKHIDIAESEPHITLQMLSTHVYREMRSAAGLAQEPWFTGQNSIHEPPWFFPNPHFDEEAAARRASLEILLPDPVARAVLDEVADPDHFRGRAYGFRDRRSGGLMRCLFTGRREIMQDLSAWLAASSEQPGRLRVITGQPGSGKSAILGAVVCLSHPELRQELSEIRARLSGLVAPPIVADQAIIHARNRGGAEILGSIGRQLQLGGVPENGWTAVAVAERLRRRAVRPLITLDGIDEANNPVTLLQEVLLPLIAEDISDVLIGVRPYETFGPLFELASRAGGLLDIDTRYPVQRRDLEDYLADLLVESRYYADNYVLRSAISKSAAERLVPGSEYLAAGLFADHLDSLPVRVEDTDAIRTMVPESLDKLLEIRLEALGDRQPLSRAVLAALARAKGAGMPRSVLESVTRSFVPPGTAVTEKDVAEALDTARFYLRHSVDEDGTVLYRLFHQAFNDLLRRDPDDGRFFDWLVLPLEEHDGRQWSRALPYVRRHAIEHAAEARRADELLGDTEFLVYAEPDTLYPFLGSATSGDAAKLTAVYRTSGHIHRTLDAPARRDMLAMDAARWGMEAICRALARPPWSVKWATGTSMTGAFYAQLGVAAGELTHATVATKDGRPFFIACATDGSLRVWDPLTCRAVDGPIRFGLLERNSPLVACEVNGRLMVAAVDINLEVILCDLRTGAVTALAGPPARTVCMSTLDGQQVLIVCGHGRTVFDLASGDVLPLPEVTFASAIKHVSAVVLGGRTVLVASTVRGAFLLADLLTGAQWRPVPEVGLVRSVTSVKHGGRDFVVTHNGFGLITVVDIIDGVVLASHKFEPSSGRDVAVVVTDDALRVVAETGVFLSVWEVRYDDFGKPYSSVRTIGAKFGTWTYSSHASTLMTTITPLELHGKPMVVTGNANGSLMIWDLKAEARLGDPAEGHIRLRSVAMAGSGDQMVAISYNDFGASAWSIGARPGDRRIAEIAEHLAFAEMGTIRNRPAAVVSIKSPEEVIEQSSLLELRLSELWRFTTRRAQRRPILLPPRVTAVTIAQLDDRPVCLVGTVDGDIEFWDLVSRKRLGRPHELGSGPITALRYASRGDRRIVVVGTSNGEIVAHDVDSGEVAGRAVTPVLSVRDIHAGLVGEELVVIALGTNRSAYRIGFHRGESTVSTYEGRVRAMTAITTGNTQVLVLADEGGVVRQLDFASGREIARPLMVMQPVIAIAAAEDALLIGFRHDLALVRMSPDSEEGTGWSAR